MTYEEALKTLDETVIGNLELKIIMSKALEKQIPKKPIEAKKGSVIYSMFGKWIVCPTCGESANGTHFCNCPYCGQALDWSKNQ